MRGWISVVVLGFSCVVNAFAAEEPSPTSELVAGVLRLSQANVEESVILAYVEGAPRSHVTADSLVQLHTNGIPSRVLVAIVKAHPPANPAPVVDANEAAIPVADESLEDPIIVEAPVVDYVSVPVYVGVGSVYYDDWWGWGWGWGWAWSSWCYPWYGCGWYYPNYCSYYSHWHHGHHGHGGGHHGNYTANANSGRHSSAGGHSTVANSAINSRARTGTSVKGAASTASATRSGGNANNASPNNGRVATARAGNTTARNAGPIANARTSTPNVAQHSGTRSAVASQGAFNSPATTRSAAPNTTRTAVAPTRPAPNSRIAGTPNVAPSYHGGGQHMPAMNNAGNGHAERRFSSPSTMGNYAPSRSSGAGNLGGFYGGGAPRGFSGGGGGGFHGGHGGGGFGGGGRR